LHLPVSARVAALGEKQVALFNPDVSTVSANSAYAQSVEQESWYLARTNYLGDVSLTTAWGIFRKGETSFVTGIRYFGYGELNQIDENGDILGDVSAYDMALTAGFSRTESNVLNYGLQADVIRSRYADVASLAVSLSGGLYYADTLAQFSAGLTFHHAGNQISGFQSDRFSLFAPRNEALPFDVRLGFSKKPEHLPLRLLLTLHSLYQWEMRTAADVEKPSLFQNISRKMVLGGELELSDRMVFRVGFDKFRNDQLKSNSRFDSAGLSMGLGFSFKKIDVDVSRTSFSDLGFVLQWGLKGKL
jgi:hypothetical protein